MPVITARESFITLASVMPSLPSAPGAGDGTSPGVRAPPVKGTPAARGPFPREEEVEGQVLRQADPGMRLCYAPRGAEVQVRERDETRQEDPGAGREEREPGEDPEQVPRVESRRQQQERTGQEKGTAQWIPFTAQDEEGSADGGQ